jgi:DNA primase
MNQTYKYLLDRGLTEETIENFNIGYVENNQCYWKVSQELITSRFYNCIFFPVYNLYGNLVGHSVRRLKGTPKFDTTIAKKSKVVYGLNKTYRYILEKGYTFVVEGIFDFLVMWQSGFRNSVAILGSNMSFDQFCLLNRFTDRFCLVFDGDSAGFEAATTIMNHLKERHVQGKLVQLPVGFDPDDYLLKIGREEFLKLCNKNC